MGPAGWNVSKTQFRFFTPSPRWLLDAGLLCRFGVCRTEGRARERFGARPAKTQRRGSRSGHQKPSGHKPGLTAGRKGEEGTWGRGSPGLRHGSQNVLPHPAGRSLCPCPALAPAQTPSPEALSKGRGAGQACIAAEGCDSYFLNKKFNGI